MKTIYFVFISFFLFGCAIVTTKELGDGQYMKVTGCALLQEHGLQCLEDLRKKAIEDCANKKLKYQEIRSDMNPGAKVVYKCL